MTHGHPYGAPAQAAQVLEQARSALSSASAFQTMPVHEQNALTHRLDRVRRALLAEPQSLARPADPYDTNVLARPMSGPFTGYGGYSNFGAQPPAAPAEPVTPEGPKSMLRAVNDLPAATGAMMEELGFADFVASLVHGTFDAIVDSTIRQMEAFASLVASLSQTAEDFSSDNVSTNQVRDWLVERYPRDLQLVLPSAEGQQPRILPRASEDEWGASPEWLADFGAADQDLTEELIDTQIIPKARIRIGEDRMRTLASMTLMGMNRVRVDRGEISAKVRIRAKASDSARVGFAQDQDGAGGNTGWSGRAGFSAPAAQAMVSTSVNAQSDGAIAAELQGEVRIVFSSDMVPLESFVSDAQRVLLQRTAQTQTSLPTPAQAGQNRIPVAAPQPVAVPEPRPSETPQVPARDAAPDTGGPTA